MMNQMLKLALAAAALMSGSMAQDMQRWAEIKFGMYRWLLEQETACGQSDGLALADIVGEVMRFVGHDFMSDFVVDGCLGLAHPENRGLGYTLTQVYNNTQVCPEDISKADCAVLLSEVAMDVTARPYGTMLRKTASPRSSHRRRLDEAEEGAGVEALYLNEAGFAGVFNMSLSVGRVDTPLGSCEAGHPVRVEGAGEGGPPVGLNDNLNFTELWRVLSGDFQCDFTEENVIAIMGVHTVGRAEKANSNISGFWVDPRRSTTPNCRDGSTFGCMPSTFDKAYYDGFFEMGWQKNEAGMWRCIPNSMGVNVSSLDETLAPDAGSNHSGLALHRPDACFPNSLRLPADMIIMFELDENSTRCEWVPVNGTDGSRVQSSCRLRETWGEVLEYAVDNDEWLVAFREAWVKMVTCGQTGLTPFPHLSLQAAAAAGLYVNGSLAANLSDGEAGGATCGGVCEPFGPSMGESKECFKGMLSSDYTPSTTADSDSEAAAATRVGAVGLLLALNAALSMLASAATAAV
eukprot:CAMPEP_0178400944 /NCGR_PEP_ID=MMETSP0689_2-20121128/16048_1 /TAXON_ID=160604 /ORGANISM="Amphidinium massartii, Strain CS-259" /LENGTH=518 /DNA_ID=CAMNT_0020021751 /DNA_START=113 /DNA_END=1669 /DNA_ORIENTATION=-